MNTIQDLIKQHHNQNLLIPTESPNGNRITLLWNDGEVTETKGGWAFMQRSQFTMRNPIPNINITMPKTLRNNTSYMMVKDLETADKIRNEMLNYKC
jgi:hypothetical protein